MKNKNDETINIENIIPAEKFAKIINLVVTGAASSTIAVALIDKVIKTKADPDHTEERQISDIGLLEAAIEIVITQNTQAFEDFKRGKKESLMFLVGQVMKQTKGKANPQMTAELIEKRIKKL